MRTTTVIKITTLSLLIASIAFGSASRILVEDQLQSSDLSKTWTMPAVSDTLIGSTTTTSLQNQINTKTSTTLQNSRIYVGNGSNVATAVPITGDVLLGNDGSVTVTAVGTSSAANIHSAELAANAATSANTATTIVKRDGSGNFSAGTITATLTGNATNVSGTVAVANGGTSLTTLTAHAVIIGNGAAAPSFVTPGASSNVLQSNGTDWVSAPAGAASVTSTTGYEPELWVLNGGISVVDDFDGMRRAENGKTIQKIITCAYNSGTSGSTVINVKYGPTLGQNTDVTLTANGGKNCSLYTPAIPLIVNDLMDVSVTQVATGVVENLSLKFTF